MAKLEEISKDTCVRGLIPNATVTVVDVKLYGSEVIEVVYRAADGSLGTQLLYRDSESNLEIVTAGRPWSFTGDGELLRLVSEAFRIRMAHLFDPVLAVHTSVVNPLPHQITAVYEEMLTRQPLRFVLADDPGAGKTIMAGLFIKELLIRGDLHQCMIVAPGNLVEQWQDELSEKFQLHFDIMTNDKLESAQSGNYFLENRLVICRLDKLSRNEVLQEKLKVTDWDLIVVDEAHKMSASFFGGEVKETQRFKLGKFLSELTRHFLLMTATPHNGKEEDFQLFLSLLDGDRFEGRFRSGVHVSDVSDIMRRMVKEQLVTFDETPLFPERRAYAVGYDLGQEEEDLYKAVSDYVRQEFNRVEALQNDGRKGTVGFALTILQRRLASSPEAIYQSLRRRRERLENRLREEKLLKRSGNTRMTIDNSMPQLRTDDDMDDFEDRPGGEFETTEEQILDQATAADTIAELELEIDSLKRLEELARSLRNSGKDKKWEELSSLLQGNEHMFDQHGHRRKLVIFSEHRDTLNYLAERIRTLLGKAESVVTITGGMLREERRNAQNKFTQDKDVLVLVATDAAGEGINLQRAHLMVNYDLPWNPNRLEQRFGRIHRIGQTEVCYLWNLIATETREGAVFLKLLAKLETERAALGGAVFDVLGQAIEGRTLRDLMTEAIRYGNDPDVRERMFHKIENALDHQRLQELIENRALSHETMNTDRVRKIRANMERANARRLQPHFISTFFRNAFEHLGGSLKERETKRFEITRVPAMIGHRDRIIGNRESVLSKYERITFHKDLVNVPGKAKAEFVCPGHPLLDATLDLILERHRDLLKQGAVLIDEHDLSEDARVIMYLEHSIQDAKLQPDSSRRVVSRQLQFVSIDHQGTVRNAGYAPYLDCRGATAEELTLVQAIFEQSWLTTGLEQRAIGYAIAELVPRHFREVKTRKEELIDKTCKAVQERLIKEITYWNHRAQELKAREAAGNTPKLNSRKAEDRANDLASRLQKRMSDLQLERQLSPLPPIVMGGAMIVPAGLLRRLQGQPVSTADMFARETKRIELLAMDAVMQAEITLGNMPKDVSADKCGYDVESTDEKSGRLRFIEVKGRVAGTETLMVTRNEVVTGINSAQQYILAIVEVEGDRVQTPVYVRQPFEKEPDFEATSVNYRLADLTAKGSSPS